ncbi:MAG: glycosyltransferase family A protein, partial [Bacteroidota bacterium]
MAALPFVSVVIPNYNNAKRLGECLRALRAQQYPADRFEIIVVDNDSTDNAVAVAQQHRATVLHQHQLKSPYPSRNMGIKAAKGSLIAQLDSTLVPEPQWLAEAVRVLQSDDQIG